MGMKALITGCAGQDGYYLSQILLEKGYEVIGTRRGTEEQGETPPGVRMVFGDVTDTACMRDLCEEHRPTEVYNLAAITHVGDSFSAMAASFQVNATGCANTLDAAARVGARFLQASTSELFGDTPPPQREDSPMRPRSPYAVAKLAAYWLTRNYRERGAFAAQTICFNHESARRGGGFVTQKVARAVAAIKKGQADHVTLGNLDAMRDWGHAADYVRGMWLTLQQDKPDDYVLATGEMRSIRDLCAVAFGCVDLDYRDYVRSSPEFFRPLEVERLCGDPSKMHAIGWEPRISFDAMITEMVDAALEQ
jgi:GDPmannose 4,6-dehydratase